MTRLAALLAFFTGACSMQLPPPIAPIMIQPVVLPGIPVTCKPTLGPEPIYFSAAEFMQAPDIQTLIAMFKADRKVRIAYESEISAALKVCSGQ